MNTTGERLVDDYLARLHAALAGIPTERRREIVEEIEAHLAAAVEAAPGDEAALREALDRLGEPGGDRGGGAGAPGAWRSRRRRGAAGWRRPRSCSCSSAACIGGFGWLVGVVLLWMSDVWRVRDKLIGTLVLPGGLAFPAVLLVGVGVSCRLGQQHLLRRVRRAHRLHEHGRHARVGAERSSSRRALVLCVALPIATAVYLGRRSRPAPEPG